MPKRIRKKTVVFTTALCIGFVLTFYLGIILKNPFENSLWFNKISLKRSSVEVVKKSIDNIKKISINDSIEDYDFYDYLYIQKKDMNGRFFLIDYWNYGILDEDDYDERKLEISITFQDFFNESPFGEEYLVQKFNTLSNVEEKINLLNCLFNVYAYKNKLSAFGIFLDRLNETDTNMQEYIEKSKLDAKDNGLRRRLGH